jgi:hypothetical protein
MVDLYPTTNWVATINTYAGRYPAFYLNEGVYQLRDVLELRRPVYLYGSRDSVVSYESSRQSGIVITGDDVRLDGFTIRCHPLFTRDVVRVEGDRVTLNELKFENANSLIIMANTWYTVHAVGAANLKMLDCELPGPVNVAPAVRENLVYLDDDCSDAFFSGNYLGRDWSSALHAVSYKQATGCIGKNLPDVAGDSETNFAYIDARP